MRRKVGRILLRVALGLAPGQIDPTVFYAVQGPFREYPGIENNDFPKPADHRENAGKRLGRASGLRGDTDSSVSCSVNAGMGILFFLAGVQLRRAAGNRQAFPLTHRRQFLLCSGAQIRIIGCEALRRSPIKLTHPAAMRTNGSGAAS